MIDVEGIFMDSGAWGLFTQQVLKRGKSAERIGKHGRILEPPPIANSSLDFSYFNLTKGSPFREYCDNYAKFMKAMAGRLDFCANVDVIGNPELTMETQRYFEEEHGLRPVPVIHQGSSMKYVEHYLGRNYDMIGLGGFASGVGGWETMRPWCDDVFMIVCPASNKHLPVCKVHGFAMTGLKGIWRWPWFSVDSTSWLIWPANGWIPVPRWSETKGWMYDRQPMVINACPASSTTRRRERHMLNISERVRGLFLQYMKEAGVPIGEAVLESVKVKGEWVEKWKMVEWGIVSHHRARMEANLYYFKELQNNLPAWPWPLNPKIMHRRRAIPAGFGL